MFAVAEELHIAVMDAAAGADDCFGVGLGGEADAGWAGVGI